MGECGMSYADFRMLTIPELEEVIARWREANENRRRDEWERMRLHAVMVMQPHCKNRISPKSVLPFPWEKAPIPKMPSTPLLDKDTARKDFEELMARMKGRQ